jgi:hypothetical protein
VPPRSSRPNNPDAEVARLIDAWAKLPGNRGELARICRDILARRQQGYAVAVAAQVIIRAHADFWRLDVGIDRKGSRANARLLKMGPKVVRRLDRALRDMIDLHRRAQDRPWYGKKIVAGEIKRRRDGSPVMPRRPWAHFPRLYERTLKAIGADSLWQTLRDTPTDMWMIPPRGNPAKRRNGALKKALRSAGLTKLQVDDVIHALGWTVR